MSVPKHLIDSARALLSAVEESGQESTTLRQRVGELAQTVTALECENDALGSKVQVIDAEIETVKMVNETYAKAFATMGFPGIVKPHEITAAAIQIQNALTHSKVRGPTRVKLQRLREANQDLIAALTLILGIRERGPEVVTREINYHDIERKLQEAAAASKDVEIGSTLDELVEDTIDIDETEVVHESEVALTESIAEESLGKAVESVQVGIDRGTGDVKLS